MGDPDRPMYKLKDKIKDSQDSPAEKPETPADAPTAPPALNPDPVAPVPALDPNDIPRVETMADEKPDPSKVGSPSNSEEKKPGTVEAPASDAPSKPIVVDKGKAFDAMLAAKSTDDPSGKKDAPV